MESDERKYGGIDNIAQLPSALREVDAFHMYRNCIKVGIRIVAADAIDDLLARVRELENESPYAGVPDGAYCLFMDGNQWCCVDSSFVNLQESVAGFGPTMAEALCEYRLRRHTEDHNRSAMKKGAMP